MEGIDYWETIRESLKSFWKRGQELEITGYFEAKPEQGLCCMLCHWPLTGEKPRGPGLRHVYLLTNLNTGHSITVGAICKQKYQIALTTMKTPTVGSTADASPDDPDFELPDFQEELAERTLNDEDYYYFFCDDEWEPGRE
jgi:hypothetical protein